MGTTTGSMNVGTDLQTTIDIANRQAWGAKRDAVEMMANHLRHDHGWGIRRIGKRLGMTDREVKIATNETA